LRSAAAGARIFVLDRPERLFTWKRAVAATGAYPVVAATCAKET
jgi:hypothetical protein